MSVSVLLAVVFGVAFAVALSEAVLLAEHVEQLKSERAEADRDRQAATRAYAAQALLATAYDLGASADAVLARRNAPGGIAATLLAEAETQRQIADWIEQTRVPMLRRATVPGVKR